MQIQKVEFEPPIKNTTPKPFTGFVCVAYADNYGWLAGCDTDSALDAYSAAMENVEYGTTVYPHTVQMFKVGDE